MTVSSRSDSPTVPATAATQDTKMASTEETAEGPAVSEGTVSPSPEDKHDDEPTTSNDRIPDDDQHVSRDSEHVEDSSDDEDGSDDDDDDEEGKASSSDESPTSVADDIPEGDSNADLHALLAFSKKRLDTVKPVPDESQQDNNNNNNNTNTKSNDEAQNEAKEEQQEEKKEDDDEEGDEDQTKETNDVAAAGKTTQDVPDETVAADDIDGSNADTADASKAKADDEATAAAKLDGMSSKEAAAKASQAGEDSNKELWALLSYSKQRLETGAHAGQKKDKKKSGSSRKKRSSSIGTSGSMKSPLTSPTASPARNPRKTDAAADTDMEELHLDGGDYTTGNVEDEGGQHSRKSVASETLHDEDADGPEVERVDDGVVEEEYSNDDEEELSSDEEGSEVGSSDEEEESDDDSTGGIPATPAFLRQLEETDKEDPDSTDAKLMSDAARSYADAILSVADEKTTGDLTDEQMLEAMCVAEAAAAAGEERFTTSIAKLRLHEAKEASKKVAVSMKEEAEKAAKTAKAAKDRQVARQNKIFSGKRPAGRWIKGKMKEFQETCAKVDGGQP